MQAGLIPGKEMGAEIWKIGRKDEAVFKWFEYDEREQADAKTEIQTRVTETFG